MIKITNALIAAAFALSLAGSGEVMAKAKAKAKAHRAKPAPTYQVDVRKPYYCTKWDAYGARCGTVGD